MGLLSNTIPMFLCYGMVGACQKANEYTMTQAQIDRAERQRFYDQAARIATKAEALRKVQKTHVSEGYL